jgi:hypothetical protein
VHLAFFLDHGFELDLDSPVDVVDVYQVRSGFVFFLVFVFQV